jgi:mannitol 2-dehydrogenase
MKEILKLNANNLTLLPKEVRTPTYDRSKIKAGIVHIGVGGFHRSHEAYYVDKLLERNNETSWGICGVALLDNDQRIFDTLESQNGLYTIMITEPDGTLNVRVIGSIIECLFAPADPEAVLEKMADRDIKIITLTITEGGYNFDSATGEFQIEEPSIQWDLNNPENPRTVFGYLTQALKRRRDRHIEGLTIQSCDNIQKNGHVMKKMLLSYVKEAEPGLITWIEKHVTFPDCMVDRITPVTMQSDIEKLKSAFGIDDGWPVVCEPFIQWVVEDNYSNGRPEWESVGVQIVSDVCPYEKMKIRLLNAGHSLLGFSGSLYGCNTIDETVRIPLFGSFLREFMDIEVTPILEEVRGINIEDYKDCLIQRFGNQNIKDKLSRICLESSAKIPKFLLPTIKEQLGRGGEIKRSVVVIAGWCRYLELAGTTGHDYNIEDRMGVVLRKNAIASMSDDPLAFLKIESIFNDLVRSKRFVDTYLSVIESIREYGIAETIRNLNQIVEKRG